MNLYYLGVVLGMAILTIGSIQAQNSKTVRRIIKAFLVL